jgi:shikimate kinase
MKLQNGSRKTQGSPPGNNMDQDKSNIVLIGMPGSGKSTVGVLVAKEAARGFVDTDLLIQSAQGRTLQDIVDSDGHMALRKIEEAVLLTLTLTDHVIATGGSAAYSHEAMTHLKGSGTVVFLDVNLKTLRSRIHNYDTRGLAKRPDQTLDELFDERLALYTRYADITVKASDIGQDMVCSAIIDALAIQRRVPNRTG